MSLFIRKIDKGKWLQKDIPLDEDVPADAITKCMKTDHNTLSVWEISDEDNIDEAVLAIVSGGQHLDAIDVAPINTEHLEENKIDYIRTGGRTPVKELVDTHRDLSNLSYKKLGIVAYHIADKIKDNQVKRYTRGRLKEILRDAIEKGRLRADELDDSIRKEL